MEHADAINKAMRAGFIYSLGCTNFLRNFYCGVAAAGAGGGRLVSSVPATIALRIWPNKSVRVLGVWGIRTVLVWSLAAISLSVSKYCVIRTSCITSWGVDPCTA